jgi:hypothetical protein
VVVSDVLLARSQSATIHLEYLDAYPQGFEFLIEARTAGTKPELRREGDARGLDIFGRHWPVLGESRDEIPPQLLRVGVQFADGRKATNIAGRGQPPAGPTLWPCGGGGGGGHFRQGYWVSPLPPAGPVGFVCQWPAAGIGLARHELDAGLILDGAARARVLFPKERTGVKDGRDWRIGTDADVAWIKEGTSQGTDITQAIPPNFACYCALGLPGSGEAERTSHEQAVIELLSEWTPRQPWWLGYLDTGASDVVFPYAPRATIYYGHPYVLVEAGPRQAAIWRHGGFNWALPDLMFPADRSWLVSTMWDHVWTSIGGPEKLVSAFCNHPELGPRARRVTPGQAMPDAATTS